MRPHARILDDAPHTLAKTGKLHRH